MTEACPDCDCEGEAFKETISINATATAVRQFQCTERNCPRHTYHCERTLDEKPIT